MRFLSPRLLAFFFALTIALATISKAKSLGSPDFKVFYTAAHFALTNPADIYRVSPDRYLYPPSTAIFLAPFALVSYSVAQWIWHGLLGILLFGFCALSVPSFAAMALLTRYLTISFFYGQINLPVIAMLAAAGIWLRRRASLAGVFWAVATSVKVYPVVFAPAFFPKKERQGIYAGAAAGAVILFLPVLFFGWELGVDLYRQFFNALGAKGLPLHSNNQSIAALLLRLFTDDHFYLHAVGDEKWTLLKLPVPLVRGIALGIGLSLSGLSWWKVFRKQEGWETSAAAFSILFLSHIAWKDYSLLLYFPLTELFGRLPKKRAWALGLACLAIITISSPDIVGHPVSTRLDAACIHLWVAWMRTKK
ncbi:MAG: glycosyltransferase family 87 protein [Bdellovibrionota bacterium]